MLHAFVMRVLDGEQRELQEGREAEAARRAKKRKAKK